MLLLFAVSSSLLFWYGNYSAKIKKSYNNFRDLNALVATKYKDKKAWNQHKIILVSLQMVAKMYWIQLMQWINTSIQHIDRHTAIVSYVLNGKLYRIAVRERRGPSDVRVIRDENHEIVTDEILPFYGPNCDWHGFQFTPQFWNKNELHFELTDGSSLSFQHNQDIKLI